MKAIKQGERLVEDLCANLEGSRLSAETRQLEDRSHSAGVDFEIDAPNKLVPFQDLYFLIFLLLPFSLKLFHTEDITTLFRTSALECQVMCGFLS